MIGRELVCSTWFDRWLINKCILIINRYIMLYRLSRYFIIFPSLQRWSNSHHISPKTIESWIFLNYVTHLWSCSKKYAVSQKHHRRRCKNLIKPAFEFYASKMQIASLHFKYMFQCNPRSPSKPAVQARSMPSPQILIYYTRISRLSVFLYRVGCSGG